MFAFGELGLTGVVRPVGGEERRRAAGAARRLRHAVIPRGDGETAAGDIVVGGIDEAIEHAFLRS